MSTITVPNTTPTHVILGVFSENRVKGTQLRQLKQYAWLYQGDLPPAGAAFVLENGKRVQVTGTIANTDLQYYNSVTGDLTVLMTSTNSRPLVQLVIRDQNAGETQYAAWTA